MKTSAKWILAILVLTVASARASDSTAPISKKLKLTYKVMRIWYTQNGDQFQFHEEATCDGSVEISQYDVRSNPDGSGSRSTAVSCDTTYQNQPAQLRLKAIALLTRTDSEWATSGSSDSSFFALAGSVGPKSGDGAIFQDPYSGGILMGSRDLNSTSFLGSIPMQQMIHCGSSNSASSSHAHPSARKSFIKSHDESCALTQPESFFITFETGPQ